MLQDPEIGIIVTRVLGCGVSVMFLLVAIVATIAAARIKRSRGAWVIAASLFGLAFVAGIGDALDLLQDSFGSSEWVWLAWGILHDVFMVVLIVGLALVRLTAPRTETSQ